MIEIKISETGFVSGDAWERVAYQGEINSRTIHTTHPFEVVGEEEVTGYKIRCHALHQVKDVYSDDKNNTIIPAEFMSNAGSLDLQFFVKANDEYKMLSKMFSLYIEPSIEVIECRLKPGAENFIVVDDMTKRSEIPAYYLANGKIVKVNDIGNGVSKYYQWNKSTGTFDEADLISRSEIKDIIEDLQFETSPIKIIEGGTEESPAPISETGRYMVNSSSEDNNYVTLLGRNSSFSIQVPKDGILSVSIDINTDVDENEIKYSILTGNGGIITKSGDYDTLWNDFKDLETHVNVLTDWIKPLMDAKAGQIATFTGEKNEFGLPILELVDNVTKAYVDKAIKDNNLKWDITN